MKERAVRRIAFLGIMLAMIIMLSLFEQTLPPLPFLPPYLKFGLSNIVTMYCLFYIGKKEAVLLNALKSLFVFITRGPVAALLSLSGGLLSVIVLIILIYITRDRISYMMTGVFGAIFHNIGQLIAYTLFLNTGFTLYYLPVLTVYGVVLGALTGTLLKLGLALIDKEIVKS